MSPLLLDFFPANFLGMKPVDPRRFFSASRCAMSESAELYTNVINSGATMSPDIFERIVMEPTALTRSTPIFKRPALPERNIWYGFVMSTSAWTCTPLSCYHAALPVSSCYFAEIVYSVSLLEPVDPFPISRFLSPRSSALSLHHFLLSAVSPKKNICLEQFRFDA